MDSAPARFAPDEPVGRMEAGRENPSSRSAPAHPRALSVVRGALLGRPLDVAMTATRRPALFAQTLRSFEANFFSRIDAPVRLIVNIDPVWGTGAEGDEVERIARGFCRDAIVHRPSAASFGAAVQRLWSTVTAPWVLHLEDDWLLDRPVDPNTLTSLMATPEIAEIRFNKSRIRRFRIRRPRFSLNPGLLRREFIQNALRHFDPSLDPEKQIYRGPMARELFRRWRVEFYGKRGDAAIVTDIGRAWRAQRKIEKQMSTDGLSSIWVASN